MLDLDQVRKDILHWSETFVEVPHIDSDIWQKKFKDYSADQEYAKEILT